MTRYGCSIALYDGEAVLLVQRASPPYAGLWSLPGGRVETGEDEERAIIREVWEELGLIIGPPHPVCTEFVGYGRQRFRLAVFAASIVHCVPVVSNEILNWEWVPLAEIGTYRTTPDLQRIVARCIAALQGSGSAPGQSAM